MCLTFKLKNTSIRFSCYQVKSFIKSKITCRILDSYLILEKIMLPRLPKRSNVLIYLVGTALALHLGFYLIKPLIAPKKVDAVRDTKKVY